jgi:class 3 adenylate cyclase
MAGSLPHRDETRETSDMVPDVRYARSGDVNIAYEAIGEGPFDVVMIPGTSSHLEISWEVPGLRAMFEGLAACSRFIRFDKRGTGMSDRVSPATTLEARMDDVRAVMDAADSRRAAIFGISEGAPMAILFAATYPERTWALILYGGYARELRAPDYPWGPTEAEYRRESADDARSWGDMSFVEALVRKGAPAADEEEIRAVARYLRFGSSPGAFEALDEMNMGIDVRGVLPAIRVPTLVVHRKGDAWVPFEKGRHLAENISGARLVELEGEGHILLTRDIPPLMTEVERFLRRAWDAASEDDIEPDRVLATVLFTDIVGSSDHATRLGDRAWRDTLEQHHELVRRQLLRHRGTEVDTAGDGFLASFDGPARAIRCACAISDSVRDLGIDVRAGLHTGECELVDGKVAGIAVHTGARVASRAEPGEVLVSSTVKDLVAGSGIQFADRGVAALKGIPGEWRLYAVERPGEPDG